MEFGISIYVFHEVFLNHDVISLALRTTSTEMCGDNLKEGSSPVCLVGVSIAFQFQGRN